MSSQQLRMDFASSRVRCSRRVESMASRRSPGCMVPERWAGDPLTTSLIRRGSPAPARRDTDGRKQDWLICSLKAGRINREVN